MPDSVEPSIRSYRECPKPMPFAGIDHVVIDSLRCAEGRAAVGAAHKHHVGGAPPVRHHARQHIDVVVRRAAGAIDRQEYLSVQSRWVDSPAPEEATHVDRSASVKGRRLGRDLRIARALAKEGAESFAADK